MKCSDNIWPTRGDHTAAGCADRRLAVRWFSQSSHAHTPFGKLFLGLLRETAWSADYSLEVFLSNGPELVIDHPHFATKLAISSEKWDDWTVRRVEDAVRGHLDKTEDSIRSKIEPLQNQLYQMHYLRKHIDDRKAQAALAAAFPEAGEFGQFSPDPSEIYCFGEKMDASPTYLVRMLDHEPVGVARLRDASAVSWHLLKPGVSKDQRHGSFWAALAQAFAARELNLAEEDLVCDSVFAFEKPWKIGQTEQYVVDKVVFSMFDDGRKVVVKFGAGNLPARAEFMPIGETA